MEESIKEFNNELLNVLHALTTKMVELQQKVIVLEFKVKELSQSKKGFEEG